MSSFATVPLAPPLAQALEVLGFVAMTPVREHALPPLLVNPPWLDRSRPPPRARQRPILVAVGVGVVVGVAGALALAIALAR